jgi:pSer/pThr/pTyr-binding forkhead associated (FHA) protein
MKIRLEINLASDHSITFEHAGPTVRIGRAPECELHFQAEGSQVSWHHARLDLAADGLWLFDLNSTNGTLLNDHRVEGPQRLRVGDRFQLGYTGAVFTVVEFDGSPMPVGPEKLDGGEVEWSEQPKAAAEESPPRAVGPLPARAVGKGRWLPGLILGTLLHLVAVGLVLYWLFGRPGRNVPDTRPRKTARPSALQACVPCCVLVPQLGLETHLGES